MEGLALSCVINLLTKIAKNISSILSCTFPLSRWGYTTSGGTRKPVPLSKREAGSLSRLDRGGAESRETRDNVDKG